MKQTREEFEATLHRIRSDPHWNCMIELEQLIRRSHKTKECVVLGCRNPGTIKRCSILIKAVPHYWMCEDCDQYYNKEENRNAV